MTGANSSADVRLGEGDRDTSMKMLNEMMVFAQVVERGGFSAAARHLGLEASSVSRSVARLEKHLGARLLHRTTRAIALTEIGEQVFAACTTIAATAQGVQSLANQFRAAPRGTLRVSAPVAFGQLWLAPRLAGFMDATPEVDLRVTLIDRPVDLIEDGVDLAIRIAYELPPGLAARKLLSVRCRASRSTTASRSPPPRKPVAASA